MVLFALSCFGLLLFLWGSFGGSVPLRPEGYRFEAAFPEAATLAQEADVRIAGGERRPREEEDARQGCGAYDRRDGDRRKYAPIPEDTRAILRQKTLLGETFVELSPGSKRSAMLDEGAELSATQAEPTVELDEILRIFDGPTKKAFGTFAREQGIALRGGASEDLNDALGTLPEFAGDGTDALRILDEQTVALKQLIKNTGVVFGALNEREGELAELIVNANEVFDATASEKESLTETFEIFPTFLDETRFTVERLERFAGDTRPLVNDLKPVADDLGPTIRDVGALAPELDQLFADLRPAIRKSGNLRSAARFLTGACPVFKSMNAFLPEINLIFSFLNFYQPQVSDFLQVGGAPLQASAIGSTMQNPRNYLKQYGIINGRSFQFNETRPNFERGNAYLAPDGDARDLCAGAHEGFDCNVPGGAQPTRAIPGRPEATTPSPRASWPRRWRSTVSSSRASTAARSRRSDKISPRRRAERRRAATAPAGSAARRSPAWRARGPSSSSSGLTGRCHRHDQARIHDRDQPADRGGLRCRRRSAPRRALVPARRRVPAARR